MIKKLTIYMFTSLFVMSLVSSAVAKITDVMMYNYKLLQDDWDHSVASCPSGSSETHPDENEHKTCTQFKDISGLTCYKDCKCQSDYIDVNNDGICVSKDCSDYPHEDCSLVYTTVDFCPADSEKCKYTDCKYGFMLDSNGNCVCSGDGVIQKENTCTCDVAKGWGGTPQACYYDGCEDIAPCSRLLCTNDYSTTVSSCDTGYTLDCRGYSGGKECCKCTCTADATCTAANYPLESKPSNANYKECTPGCGDNTKRYAITSCKDGYELSGNACVAKGPEGFQCCLTYTYSGNHRQNALIGRYNSSKDSYEGCISGGNYYEISGPKLVGINTDISYDSYYRPVSSYSELKSYVTGDSSKDWRRMGICSDIDASEDIILDSGSNDRIQMEPCSVEDKEEPQNHTISSLENSIEMGTHTVSVSTNYSTPILTINHGSSIYNSLIKADRIYLRGKVYFSNVKIEPLYSDHIDVYIASFEEEGYNCYQTSFTTIDGDTGDAEGCTPIIGFYTSQPKHQYKKYDSSSYETYYRTGTSNPKYDNVWGTLGKPVVFHKETSDTLDGVIFFSDMIGGTLFTNSLNKDITIYGYNGDSSPVFSEFKFYNYNPEGHYQEPLTKTMKFNLKNYASNTAAPLFRRFQTFEPHPDYGFNVELNIYKDFIPRSNDDTKVASAVNEIKTNSYLSSEETCSLGTASNYVHERDFDTNECSVYEGCSSVGLYDEEISNENSYIGTSFSEWYDYCDYCRVYSSNYEETEEQWLDYCGDADERLINCDLIEQEYGAFEAVSTRCDGQTWKNQLDEDVAWNKCYKHSQVYCLDANDEESEEFGFCSESQINWSSTIEGSNASDYLCAEITDADNPGEVCDRLRNANGETYPSFSYKITDYKKHVDGSLRLNGSKCLVCSFYETNNGNNGGSTGGSHGGGVATDCLGGGTSSQCKCGGVHLFNGITLPHNCNTADANLNQR